MCLGGVWDHHWLWKVCSHCHWEGQAGRAPGDLSLRCGWTLFRTRMVKLIIYFILFDIVKLNEIQLTAAGESDPQPRSRSWSSSQSWKHKVPTHHHHHWWSTRPTYHHHFDNISPSSCQHSIFNMCQDASRSPHQCTCKRLLRHLHQNSQVRI